MINLHLKYQRMTEQLSESLNFKPDIAVILGSGLGGFTESIDVKKSISASALNGYPGSTVAGHDGKIHHAEYFGKKLLLFQGRIHFYEGYPLSECILPVFISQKLGAGSLLLTNAAGGINPYFTPGDLMLASSFNGVSIKKELTDILGVPSLKGKNNFFNFPSERFNSIIRKAALLEKIDLKEGIYWYTKGPSYETPAEIKMIQRFGGDAVGMSTAHEAVFSAYLGIETAAISCITNFAAGIKDTKLDHSEVTETANRVKEKFEKLVKKVIELT